MRLACGPVSALCCIWRNPVSARSGIESPMLSLQVYQGWSHPYIAIPESNRGTESSNRKTNAPLLVEDIYPKMSEPIREAICQVGGGCWHPGLQVTTDKGLRSVRVRGTTPHPAHGDFETFLCRGQNYHCIL